MTMKRMVMTACLAVCVVTGLSAQMRSAVMLQKEGSLWTKAENGDMKWAKTLNAGTMISLDDGTVITARRPSGNKTVESNFYRAEYDGKSFYVMADRACVAEAAQVKVIVKDAVLYTGADVLDYTSTVVPFRKVVVVGNSVGDYCPVIWFDDVNYVRKEGFVRRSKVGQGADDVSALEMVDKARASKDAAVKNAIIADAYTLRISDTVRHLIQIEEYNVLQDFNPDSVEPVTVQLSVTNPGQEQQGWYAHVYDMPSSHGTVIGRVFCGDLLAVDRRTTASTREYVSLRSESGEETRQWLHIQAHLREDGSVLWPEGWVFGIVSGQ